VTPKREKKRKEKKRKEKKRKEKKRKEKKRGYDNTSNGQLSIGQRYSTLNQIVVVIKNANITSCHTYIFSVYSILHKTSSFNKFLRKEEKKKKKYKKKKKK
jgi:hypothetical protein